MNDGSIELKETAAISYGYIAPQPFINYLSKKIINENLYGSSKLSDYEAGVGYAVDGFQENYYGWMCSGILPHLREDPETLKEHYETMSQILKPVIKAYPSNPSMQVLVNILEDLKPD